MTKLKWVNTEPSLQYRIGDAILYGENSWSSDARKRILENPDTFSQSIAYQYLCEIGQDPSRVAVDALRNVVKKYIHLYNIDLPRPDEIVIHLRLGDAKATLVSETAIIDTILRCMEFWGELPSRVTLVSAFHIGRSKLLSEDKSCHEQSFRQQTRLATNLRRVLSSRLGLPCEIRSSKNPDSDFSYLASAKYLILGSGGFSLAASLASEAFVCVPRWCIFNDGQKGNFMPVEDYYKLLAAREPYTL